MCIQEMFGRESIPGWTVAQFTHSNRAGITLTHRRTGREFILRLVWTPGSDKATFEIWFTNEKGDEIVVTEPRFRAVGRFIGIVNHFRLMKEPLARDWEAPSSPYFQDLEPVLIKEGHTLDIQARAIAQLAASRPDEVARYLVPSGHACWLDTLTYWYPTHYSDYRAKVAQAQFERRKHPTRLILTDGQWYNLSAFLKVHTIAAPGAITKPTNHSI